MMIGLNLMIEDANNKHAFEINHAKRNDNSHKSAVLMLLRNIPDAVMYTV
jgi:hypothetical protein